MKALMGGGDNADFCIELFKYAEKITDEMPNSESAKSIIRLLDAIRDAMSKDENIRKTLKKIVDSDEWCPVLAEVGAVEIHGSFIY